MRVAITADVPDENSPVSMVFGRCAYYAIYDSNTDKLEFVPNPGGMLPRGAGVQAAQFLMQQNVDTIITGGVVGPNASMVLAQAGMQIVNNFRGSVRDAVEAVKSGRIAPISLPRPPSPYGEPFAAMYPYYADEPPLSKEEEIRMLEEEKARIEDRLKEIKKKLKELKN